MVKVTVPTDDANVYPVVASVEIGATKFVHNLVGTSAAVISATAYPVVNS